MSRLSIAIRTPERVRAKRTRKVGTLRAVGITTAVALGIAAGSAGWRPIVSAAETTATGAARAVSRHLPADFAPPSPESLAVLIRGATLPSVHTDWAWDVERCEAAAGRGDDPVEIEGRVVACLLRAAPGAFCDAAYRRAFVARARPTIIRATEPHRRAMAGVVRPGLRTLLLSGAVRPWDFRLWRQGGRLPRMVEAIAATETLPSRTC